MRAREVHVQRLLAVYFDTADERLAAHGIAIRLRREGRRWVQTAKALTTDALCRLEHNVAVTATRGRPVPELDLARHDGTPVGSAIRAALAATGGADIGPTLIERFRIDVSRMTCNERIGAACVELALDTGTIEAGERSTPVCEFELELKSGSVADLLGIATTWAVGAGLWLSTVSKAERGVRLLRGESQGHPVGAVAPAIAATRIGCRGFLVATLASCLAQILANASEVGAGATDEAFVHQLRIGLRRLRTALRELADFAPGLDPAWEGSLRRTFQELGAHRDAVTVVPAIRDEMASAGVDGAGATACAPPLRSPQAAVQDPGFQRTLLEVLAFCHAPPAPERASVKRKIARRLDALHARLARDAKRFATLSTVQRHRVRKRLKRLRYLGEFAAPLFDADRVARYMAHWRKAQDALGVYNDHRIGRAAMRSRAPATPRGKAVDHWLAERLRACAADCERTLRKATRRPVFWSA